MGRFKAGTGRGGEVKGAPPPPPHAPTVIGFGWHWGDRTNIGPNLTCIERARENNFAQSLEAQRWWRWAKREWWSGRVDCGAASSPLPTGLIEIWNTACGASVGARMYLGPIAHGKHPQVGGKHFSVGGIARSLGTTRHHRSIGGSLQRPWIRKVVLRGMHRCTHVEPLGCG